MGNQKLQLHQFEIDSENIIRRGIYIYKWPKRLVGLINHDRKGYKFLYPISNLSDALSLAIDDIIYARKKVMRSNNNEQDEYWLFSTKMLNLNVIKALIVDWLLANKINDISYSDIQFKEPAITDTRSLFSQNLSNDLYNIIPHLYKMEFCTHKINLKSINRELDFYPVVDTQNNSTAISETIEVKDENKLERFSYAVYFQLVNNYEHPNKLFLNVKLGIKVWQSKMLLNMDNNKNYINGQNAHSIFVYKENKYVVNTQRKLLKLMYKRDKDLGYKYKNYADRVLADQLKLNLYSAFEYPNDCNELKISSNEVVLITNDKVSSLIKSGPGLKERNEVVEIFNEIFIDLQQRQLISEAKKVTKHKVNKKTSLAKRQLKYNKANKLNYIDKDKDNFFYHRPPILISKNKNIILEVYSTNVHLKNAVVEYVGEILNLNRVGQDIFRGTNDCQLRIVFKLDEISYELTDDECKNIKLRKCTIRKQLSLDNYNTSRVLSLIDIYDFHTHKELKHKDPKDIVRKTFKEYGRVTQFINSFNHLNKEDRIRLHNSLYDLISAGGFINNDYYAAGFDNKIMLGLSAVENSKGKLISLSKINGGEINYKLFGLADEDWYSIHYLLPKLCGKRIKKIIKERVDRNRFNEWFVDQINDLNIKDKQVYILFEGSLRKSHWKFASNKHLNVEELGLLNKDNIKFIRVSSNGEIPSYKILKNEEDQEGINRNQGLFTENNKVFYSVGSRADNLRVAKNATRLSSPSKMIGKQRIVEIVTLGIDDQENIKLANDIHVLRKMSLTFEHSTKYPLPLFINNRLGEYM